MADSVIPGGGKKGGTRYPNIALKQAVGYAKKLVAKTHTGPQPDTIILKGVFDSTSSAGKVRASALKQYGLLQGNVDAYDATDAARAINSAPSDELAPLLRKALFEPPVFKAIFDTFQNDTVTRAKIRQQALQLKVHPDLADKCVDLFVQSAVFAGVATENGDNILISSVSSFAPTKKEETQSGDEGDDGLENPAGVGSSEQDADGADSVPDAEVRNAQPHNPPTGARAQINVTLSLDSTMDPEKLERYMKILRQYGAIQ